MIIGMYMKGSSNFLIEVISRHLPGDKNYPVESQRKHRLQQLLCCEPAFHMCLYMNPPHHRC
jgi:hypothetical protein